MRPRAGLRLVLPVLLVLVLANAMLVWQPGITFRQEVFFLGPWGEEAGNFAKTLARDGSFLGPRHFAVVGDQVLVADVVNEQLVILTLSPTPAWVDMKPLPDIMAVQGIGWVGGDFVIQDGESGLHRFTDVAWELWATEIETPDDATLVLASGLATTAQDKVYHALSCITPEGEIWELWRMKATGTPQLILTWSQPPALTRASGAFAVDSELYVSVLDFSVSPRGDIVVQTMEREPLKPAFLMVNAGLTHLQRLDISPKGSALPQLVGVDRGQNTYLAEGDQLVVYRSNGRILGEVSLPPAGERQSLALDDKGNFYVLVHSPEGVELVRYQSLRTGRIAFRWRSGGT